MGNSEGVKIHNCHTSSAIFSTKDYVLHEDYLAIQQQLTASNKLVSELQACKSALCEQVAKHLDEINDLKGELEMTKINFESYVEDTRDEIATPPRGE